MVKVVDLPAETDPTDDDYFVVRENSSGTTRRVTRTNLFKNPPIEPGAITHEMLEEDAVEKDNLAPDARIDPRVTAVASTNSLTPNADTTDIVDVTALSQGMTINAPTGTPANGQALLYRIKDNGTGRSLSYNATHVAVGVTLPTSTTANKWTYILERWNATANAWHVVSIGREA